MKLKLPRRRVIRALLYLLSLMLLIVAIDMILIQIGRRITIGYDTTRITGPTMTDGPIDYLSALENHFSAGVTPENNAAPLMLEALGRAALASNQPRDGITARLGMAPLPETGNYFVKRSGFLDDPSSAEYSETNDIDPLMTAPWSAKNRPRTAAWISANERPLAKLIEASKRPRFFYPYNAGFRPETITQVLLPYVQVAREATRALVTRAMLRLDQGDVDGAIADLSAVHRLAGLFSQGPTVIDRLTGFGIDWEASRAEQAIATSLRVDKPHLQLLLKTLEEMPRLNDLKDAVDVSERYMFLDSMQYGARRGRRKLIEMLQPIAMEERSAFWIAITPMQFDQAMRSGNGWYDRMVGAVQKPTAAERQAAMNAVMTDLKKLTDKRRDSSMPDFSSDWPIAAFVPAFDRVLINDTSIYADRALARAAVALALYKLDHGSFPASLEKLSAEYLREVPIDPFSETPLKYRATKEGYVLYSVWRDLVDDGGTPVISKEKGDEVIRVGEADDSGSGSSSTRRQQ